MKFRDKDGNLHDFAFARGMSAYEAYLLSNPTEPLTEEEFYIQLGKFATTDDVAVVKGYTDDEIKNVKSEFDGKLENLKRKAKELTIAWGQGGLYGTGEPGNNTAKVYTKEKYVDDGLYFITFPNELKLTFNCLDYSGKRLNIEFTHPMSFFVTNGDFIRFCMVRKDGALLPPTDPILDEVKIYYLNSLSDCDVVVATTNSRKSDKAKADIVVDDDNCTRILASLLSCYNDISIRLLDGDYMLTEYWDENNMQIVLPLNSDNLNGGASLRRIIKMCGTHITTPQDMTGVKLWVTENLHNQLDSNNPSVVLGNTYKIVSGEIARLAVGVEFKYFNIIGFAYDKPITYVDTTRTISTLIDNVNVRSRNSDLFSYTPFDYIPHAECCGIRVGRGSNYGILCSLKHLNVWYCGKGIACNGEHFVFEDVKTHHCYIGWYFGDKVTVGNLEHPNILLGCSIEACYRLMTLTKGGETVEKDYVADGSKEMRKSTLIVIGMSTERSWHGTTDGASKAGITLPINEIIKGLWRGRIEIDMPMSPFEEGSGINFTETHYN